MDRILDAACAAFCADGYEAATVAGIAGRMGVVEGTVYKYFDSKRELLLRVLERWYTEMVDSYARDLNGVIGTRARLHWLIWRHLRTIRDNPQLSRLMFREVRSEYDYRRSSLYQLNRRYTELLTEVLRRGVVGGEVRGDLPPALLRDMIYGGVEHHTWQYLAGHAASLDIDTIAGQIGDLLWQGMQYASQSAAPAKREAQR
jgi:AcrR family transcriptional regulator